MISGTFPAIKDGKTIEITYNDIDFKGNVLDRLGSEEVVVMPYYKGYSTDQEYVTFNIQRDPSTNEVTGITLPNGIPTYTKNGTKVSTSDESNEAYETSLRFPNGEGQEKLSNSTDITPAQKADAQKWESQMKSSFRVTKDMSLITDDDVHTIYILGLDGWFTLSAKDLTPQTDIFETFSEDNNNKDDFFMHFNDNKDRSDTFFDNHGNYHVFATATANDGSIKRNLIPSEINQFLEQKGGKGVTFHFGVQYLRKDSNQVASKDVVVLPLDADSTNTGSNTNTGNTTNTGSNTNTGNTTNTGSNTNTGSTTNTGSNTNTGSTTNTDSNTNTGNTTNTNTSTTNDNDSQTTPATSYHSVYTSTKGIKLYDDKGGLIDSVNLGKNTTWRVDQKQVIKGVTYLRVATNEWVREDNGLEVELINSVVTTNKKAVLYNSKGEKIISHVLGSKTSWRTDRTAQINGKTMYRVATDEWVLASDIQ